MRLACDWIINRAMMDHTGIAVMENPSRYAHTDWRGAVREYDARQRRWHVFAPLWHTGQAVKSLVLAWRMTGADDLLDAARRGAAFLMRARRENGMLVAYENSNPLSSATSCMFEALDGLFELSEATSDPQYQEAAMDALQWAASTLFLPDEGLFLDDYHLDSQHPASAPNTLDYGVPGRPLLDDGVFLRGYHLSGDRRLRDVFFRTAERLLQDEEPAGNWINYPPCHPRRGILHPRHAFWWGRPMIMAWKESGDNRYLACAKRCADWYVQAQRSDGGIFRETNLQFMTPSFGQATSGILAAACLWNDLIAAGEGEAYIQPLRHALQFGRSMQLTDTRDPNLTGSILEKCLPPDGTDRLPYLIRDLGTIFYIQALAGAWGKFDG